MCWVQHIWLLAIQHGHCIFCLWVGLLGLVIDSQTTFSVLLTSVLCSLSWFCSLAASGRWKLALALQHSYSVEQLSPPASPFSHPSHVTLPAGEDINFMEEVGLQLKLGQSGVLKRLIWGGHAYVHLHGSFTVVQEQGIKFKLVAIKKRRLMIGMLRTKNYLDCLGSRSLWILGNAKSKKFYLESKGDHLEENMRNHWGIISH